MSAAKRTRVACETSKDILMHAARETVVRSSVREGVKAIGTHHGKFHCDEVLACTMLRALPDFAGHEVVRTRDEAELARCDIVVDVGAVYDHARRRYDHHQPEFQDTMEGHDIRLSSAGLVYRHYGEKLLRLLSSRMLGQEAGEDAVAATWNRVYERLIKAVDAIDNGVEIAEGPLRYKITSDLGSRVARCNPRWNEPQSPDEENARFVKAMALAADELGGEVEDCVLGWLPARGTTQEGITEGKRIDAEGRLLVLKQFAPWQEHLLAAEAAAGEAPTRFALFPDPRGNWRVQAVPIEAGSFQNRQPLPKKWRGLRGEALSAECGVEGAIFVHAAGFIGGHSTFEGAVAMAKRALEVGSGDE